MPKEGPKTKPNVRRIKAKTKQRKKKRFQSVKRKAERLGISVHELGQTRFRL